MSAPADRPAAPLADNDAITLEEVIDGNRPHCSMGPLTNREADALEDELARLRATATEVARLRAALESYADRARWQSVAVPLANGNVRLCATFDGGWGVADAALTSQEES